uniref:Fn3_like domain-containing protein n=1 Tax=Ascaris lumbricoides TaxID=6252 RepID=A0A0M3HXJ1_ASCLU
LLCRNIFVAEFLRNIYAERYLPIQNADTEEFGLAQKNGITCLLLKFSAKLYNLNLNGTNIVSEIPKISSSNVKINGYCALNDSKKNAAYLQIKWNTEDRKKSLKLYFVTANVKTLVKQLEELRWLMSNVTYTESYSGQSVEFSSSDVVISAPLKQKFVCGDKLNISLHSDRFKDYILELEPEIHAQPYNAAEGRANIYVCERTRRRTLAESFQNKMTIASGVVLGIASVSMLVGYSVRRQLNPSRQQLYQSLS